MWKFLVNSSQALHGAGARQPGDHLQRGDRHLPLQGQQGQHEHHHHRFPFSPQGLTHPLSIFVMCV